LGGWGFTVSPPEKTVFWVFFAHFFNLRNAESRGWSGDFASRNENRPRAKTIKKQSAIVSSNGPAIFNCKGPDAFAKAPVARLMGIGFADVGCDIWIALYLPLCARGG
jgi:hypothetical protein